MDSSDTSVARSIEVSTAIIEMDVRPRGARE